MEWKDVYGGIWKSLSFGLIISWICCYKGFYTKQSAEGLGTATTEAVVLSDRVVVLAPRPGRVREIVPIDLPRPRHEDVEDSDDFHHAVGHIRHLLREGMGP